MNVQRIVIRVAETIPLWVVLAFVFGASHWWQIAIVAIAIVPIGMWSEDA